MILFGYPYFTFRRSFEFLTKLKKTNFGIAGDSERSLTSPNRNASKICYIFMEKITIFRPDYQCNPLHFILIFKADRLKKSK